MKNLTITALRNIAKGDDAVQVRVAGKGSYSILPWVAEALLTEATSKDHAMFTHPNELRLAVKRTTGKPSVSATHYL